MLYIKLFASENKKSMKLDNRRKVYRPRDIKKIAISRSLAEAFIDFQKGMWTTQEEQICLLCYSYALENNPHQW